MATMDSFHDYWDGITPTPWKDPSDPMNQGDDFEPSKYTLAGLHTFQLAIDVGFDNYQDFVDLQDKFLTSMYGTPEWVQEDVDWSSDEEWVWSQGEGGHVAAGTDKDWWGMDIQWKMKDEEGNDITKDHSQFYEYATGQIWNTEEEAMANVNWDYYQDDNKWQQTHASLGGDDLIDSFEEIRDANKLRYKDVLKEARGGSFDPTKPWDGMYVKKFDAENPPQYDANTLNVFEGYTREPLSDMKVASYSVKEPDFLIHGHPKDQFNKVNVTRPKYLPGKTWDI